MVRRLRIDKWWFTMNFGDAMVGLRLSRTLVTDGLHMSRLDLLSSFVQAGGLRLPISQGLVHSLRVKLLDLPWSSRLEAVIWQVCCLKWDYVDLVRSCFYLHLIRFVNRFLHGSAVRLRVSSPCPGTLQLLRGLARHIIEALTVSQSQRLPAAFAPLRQCQRLRQQH